MSNAQKLRKTFQETIKTAISVPQGANTAYLLYRYIYIEIIAYINIL